MKEYDKAISDFTTALKLDPKSANALYERGVAWRKKGEFAKALEDLNVALKLEPDHAWAMRERGQLRHDQGDFARALADFEHVFKLDPEGLGYSALAWFWATCPDAKYRNGKKALEYALKDCALYSRNNALELNTRAAAHAELGDFKAAVHWQKQALKLAPAYDREQYQHRLELYQAGKPYRQAVKKSAKEDGK
jgi:tetratricopeptide (TPR) repeat protein